MVADELLVEARLGAPWLVRIDRPEAGGGRREHFVPEHDATRRVTAVQHGRPIFTLSASFHITEESYDHQRGMPDVPPPEALDDWETAMTRAIAADEDARVRGAVPTRRTLRLACGSCHTLLPRSSAPHRP